MMWLLPSALTLMAGCSVIDDDLTNCPPDSEPVTQFELEYQLRLVTNMTTELQTHLTTMTELSVAQALQTHLKDIFSDFAHDVDLSFYDTEGKLNRLEHVVDIIDANQTTYDLTLPMRKYLHLAVANIAENHQVGLANDGDSKGSMLQQAAPIVSDGFPVGIIASHTTGLFTARQPMEVLSGVNQTFHVHLYMANSATSLVIDPNGHTFSDIKVFATGFATAFYISDSVYVYNDSQTLVRADKVPVENDLLCFCTVNFPSRDAIGSGSRQATRADADTNNTLWQYKVYVTKSDGKITETILNLDDPLKAGDLKIVKGSFDDDGAVRPYDSTVGVSVTLDWNDGGNYDIPL